MNQLKQQLQSGELKKCYLLYGIDSYLVNYYKNQLKKAVLSSDDTMNYSYFEGKKPDVFQIIDTCNTIPFFADRRFVLVENSGLFKASGNSVSEPLVKAIPSLSEQTVLVFVEHEVDKRNRMYKAVQANGYVCELNGLSSEALEYTLAAALQANGKKISKNTLQYLIRLCGGDSQETGSNLDGLMQEVEKLTFYCGEREVVTTEDIDQICIPVITDKIFKLTNAIGQKKADEAMQHLSNLLYCREPVVRILVSVERHFKTLLLLRELADLHYPEKEIAKQAGLREFQLKYYYAQLRLFTPKELKDYLEYAALQEEKLKTGQLGDRLAVELLILYCCA